MSNAMVEVEVIIKKNSNVKLSTLQEKVNSWLREKEYVNNGVAISEFGDTKDLSEHVDYIKVCDENRLNTHLPSVAVQYR